ncbi:MAG: MarR family transcriptional regulator [Bacteroidia bacterium]|nr:MarR family transcriptional regulator [Bacteroidia bacterium]
MSIVQELKLLKVTSALHLAHLNVLFTSGYIHGKIAQILKPFQLTVEQFNVLRILKGANDTHLCIRDITCRMIDRNSNVSRIVDKLEAHHYVRRSPSNEDKRANEVLLTEKGLNLITEITEIVQPQFNKLLNLTEEEAKDLNHLLDKARSRDATKC